MDNIVKGIGKIWIDVLIAVLILIYASDIRWFFAFLFFELLFQSYSYTNYLKKLIRVLSVSTETKIIAMARKLDVSEEDMEEEIEKIMKEQEEKIGTEKWKELEKDFADITK